MSACKGCDKEIVWGVTADGKRIPLDPRAPVYRMTALNAADGSQQVERMNLAMVSHFATCPKASQFSKAKARLPMEAEG